MSYSLEKSQFLLNNVDILSEIFILNKERKFLLIYLTPKELDKCMKISEDNADQLMEMIKLINEKQNNKFFVSLFNRLQAIVHTFNDLMLDMESTCNEQDDIVRGELHQRPGDFLLKDIQSDMKTLLKRVPVPVEEEEAEKTEDEDKKIQMEINETNRMTKEIMKTLSQLSKEVDTFKSHLSPFKRPPTTRMNDLLNTYRCKWTNVKPIVCNEWGEYPIIDWTKMETASIDFLSHWIKLRNHSYDCFLEFPPIILPAELGGWLVDLWIAWDKVLLLRGWMYKHAHNENCPSQIELAISLKLRRANKDKDIDINETITIIRYGSLYKAYSYNLLTISHDFDHHWDKIPTVQLKIAPTH